MLISMLITLSTSLLNKGVYMINQVGTHKTSVLVKNNALSVVYHSTEVVKVINNRYVILDNGGYYTNTSKKRMNQASMQYNLGFNVYQCNYIWYVGIKDNILEYKNNMVIDTKTGDICNPRVVFDLKLC
jgi:hypothetical protein